MSSSDCDQLRSSDRYRSLLWAAVVSFSRHGVKGTSLRDVAAEAGTSLSLISHHFGNKSKLLDNTIASLQRALGEHVSMLSFTLETCNDLSTQALVEAWLRYATTAFANEPGVTYLQLMLRLQNDKALDAATAADLDASLPPIRRALARLYPEGTTLSLNTSLDAACGAIYKCLLASHGNDSPQDRHGKLTALAGFLVSGIEASVVSRRERMIQEEPSCKVIA